MINYITPTNILLVMTILNAIMIIVLYYRQHIQSIQLNHIAMSLLTQNKINELAFESVKSTKEDLKSTTNRLDSIQFKINEIQENRSIK